MAFFTTFIFIFHSVSCLCFCACHSILEADVSWKNPSRVVEWQCYHSAITLMMFGVFRIWKTTATRTPANATQICTYSIAAVWLKASAWLLGIQPYAVDYQQRLDTGSKLGVA